MVITLLVFRPMPTRSEVSSFQDGEILIGQPVASHQLSELLPTQPLLVVIDSPFQIFTGTGSFLHVAAFTALGEPAVGADVYLDGSSVGRTDDHGTLVFRWGVDRSEGSSRRERNRIEVRWEHGGWQWGGGVSFRAGSRTSSFASDQIFVYTDRGVFNPGDTIHVRTIAWHLASDYEPLEEADVELVLTDPQGRVVAAGQVHTDSYGIGATDLPLPTQAAEGLYELEASYESTTTQARLRVMRFTPPLIRIEDTLGRYFTGHQPELSFEVTLGYFTGAEFVSGRLIVEFLVEGSSRFRTEQEVLSAGPHRLTLDSESLTAIRRGLAEDDLVEVNIRVTDRYGRSDDVTRELVYTRNPYVAIIERDRDEYRPGDPVELVVRLTDRDRVPVRHAEVSLLLSDDRLLVATTDEQGTAQISLVMPSRELQVQLMLEDVGFPVASTRLALEGSTPMRSHIAQAIVVQERPVQIAVSFPGRFVPAERVVHVDVVDTSGGLVQSVLVPIIERDGRYLAEGSFIAPSWGSMLLTLFCLGRDEAAGEPGHPGETMLGLLTEGQNLVVHPDRQLSIHLDGVPEQMGPGEPFTARIEVTDGQGNPVEATLGASVVDLAVIGLKDPLRISPIDLFYNPRLRVLSTTGSSILTWPVVSRNWGDSRRDVALPPFPFRPGGVIVAALADKAKEGEIEEEPGQEADDLSDYAWDDRRTELEEPPTLIIRTDFEATSLWLPFLQASNGSAVFDGQVPDSITMQQFTLVASDRQGRIGVLRQPVQVTQPLFVQADLPDRLTLGDEVQARVGVQNTTQAPVSLQVALTSEDLQVSPALVRLEVPAQGTGVASFTVRPVRVGSHRIAARAWSPDYQDGEQREIWVQPLGVPTVVSERQQLTSSHPASFAIGVPSGGQMTTVTLNLTFPAVTAAFAGLAAMRSRLTSPDAFGLGGEVISAALLYRHHRHQGGDPTQLDRERAALSRARGDLLATQRPDGGWGFYWDYDSNPYVTAYCLQALIALERADLYAPPQAYHRSVQFLAGVLGSDGLYDMTAIAFWEGNSEAVQRGMTAEIFAILAELPRRGRTPTWRRLTERLTSTHLVYLDLPSPDVMTEANALLGLYRSSQAGVVELDPARLVEAAGRLDRLRQTGYWEPSWFNAYGGTIEATVAVLELYRELGQQELLATHQRDAVRYLLSTRDEWGSWHNFRGTAAAIRGLLALEPADETGPCSTVVTVDGREVIRVAIDPQDPFLSTATALGSVDLTPYLTAGRESQVVVVYDGSLQADARLTVRHWGEAEQLVATALSLQSTIEGNGAQQGELTHYLLTLQSSLGRPQRVHLDLAPPSNAEIDLRSLDGLRERGLIDSYLQTESGVRLVLELEGHSGRELDILMTALRPGEAIVPVAVASVAPAPGVQSGSLAVAVLDRPFLVY